MLLSVQITTYAQSGHTAIGDTCALRTMLNEMFEYFEKDRVSSGLLRDYAVEMADLDKYSGTVLSDTNAVNMTTYERILRTLQSARVNTSISRISTEAIVDSMRNDCYYGNTIPVSISACKYHYLPADALTNNKIGYDPVTNHVTDRYVSLIHWMNPYDSTTVLAFSPYLNLSTTRTPTFSFKSSYYIHNLPVSLIEFDPGDGYGYRTISIPGVLQANYQSNGDFDMKVRITLADNTVLLAHSPILIDNLPHHNTHNSPRPPTTTLDTTITMTTSYGTVEADVSFLLPKGHMADSLTSPLIIAEGFDVPRSLIDAFANDEAGYRTIDSLYLNSFNIKSAPSNKFEVVYIDWYDSDADIRANAELLERIIEYVNRHKKYYSNSSVLIGFSMGGLIARYALCKMEQEHKWHNVSTYVSYDSPHWGANIPLGAQYALDFYLNQVDTTRLGSIMRDHIFSLFAQGEDLTDNVMQAISDLFHNSGSVKQMLIEHIDGNTPHDDWIDILEEIGFPQGDTGQGITNICVSNGANTNWLTGGPIFNLYGKINGGLLLNTVINAIMITAPVFDFSNILSSIFTTARTFYGEVVINPNDGIAAHEDLFRISIDMQKKFLWWDTTWVNLYSYSRKSPEGWIPMDASFGSYYEIPTSRVDSTIVLDPNAFYSSGELTYHINNKFIFIPTISSLCYNGSYPFPQSFYQFNYNPRTVNNEQTPFDYIILADSNIEGISKHISIHPTICDSLAQHIVLYENGHVSEPSIIGTNLPVSGSVYAINGSFTPNITWSTGDNSIITINQYGVVQVLQNGITSINAEVIYPRDTFNLHKAVITGGFPTFTLSGVQDHIFGRQDIYATSSWSGFPGHESELGITYHWGRRRITDLHVGPPEPISWSTSTSLHYSFYGGDAPSHVFFYATMGDYTSPTYSIMVSKINPKYPQIDFPKGIVDPTGNIYMEGDNGTEILTVKAGSEEAEPIISISTAGIEDIYFDHIPSSAELMAVMLEKEEFKNMVKTMRPWGEEDYLIIPLTVNYLEYDGTIEVPLILVYEED